jgi:hypothetical protein
MDVDHIRALCLRDKALEFWVINMELQTITVYARGNTVRLCVPGDQLRLDAFGVRATLDVSEIFG